MKNNYSYLKVLTAIAGKLFAPAVFAAVLVFPSVTKAATYNLASTNPAFPVGNYCPNTIRDTIYKFTLTGSGGGGNNFTGLNFTTNPGYVVSSVTQFQLFRGGAVNNGLASGAVPIASVAAAGPGVQTFPAFNLPLGTSGTWTFWITMDVPLTPTIGNTVTVAALTTTNLTILSSTKTGSASAGGTRTIIGIVTQPPPSTTVCIGNSATLNITASSGASWTYQWTYLGSPVVPGTPAGAVYSGQNTATLNISGLGAGTYTGYRCNLGSACTITSNSASVTVSAMATYTPQIDAYVNADVPFYLQPGDPNNIVMCFRTMMDFALWSSFPPVPTYVLEWMVNNTVVDTIPPSFYSTNTLVQGDSVWLRFTNLGTQCYNSPTASNKFYFTVYPSDPPDVQTVSATPNPGCIGQAITLTATVGGQLGSSPTYQWLDNGVPIAGANSLIYTGVFSAGTHPIEFVATSSDTCSSPATDTLAITGGVVVNLCYDTMNVTGTVTINRCGGTLYDNGGPSANYSNNSNGTLSVCPALSGQFVSLSFTSFATELANDVLSIYNGPTSAFPVMAPSPLSGTLSCSTPFTSSHASGCLTLRFISNNITTNTGWAANMSCVSTAPSSTPGNGCSNPVVIATLPYSVTGQTTQCFGNSHSNIMGCSTTNTGGPDKYYSYIASTAECITIFINGASSNAVSLNVYEGCPGSGGICRASWTNAVSGTLGGQVTLPNPGTYYFVVDGTSNFNYNLTINTFGAAPLNDLPCNAEVLIQTVPHYDDNSCAGTETGSGVNNANCVSGNINSLWYSFTTNPGQTMARVRFTRGLGTLPNLNAQAYSGTCTALNYISCSNFSMNATWDCQSQPILQFSVSPSTVYFVRVDGVGNATGSYQIIADDPLNVLPAYGYDCGNPLAISAQTCTYGTPAFIGVGDQCDFPTSNNGNFFGERDGVWFLFQTVTPNANGVTQLTFDIHSDNSVTTDWDFLLLNVTAQYPSNICTYISNGTSWNTAPGMISSSWVDTYGAPNNGHTGCRVGFTQHINGWPYNAPIPLSGTQWWMLYISNFRLGQFPYGFTLEMGYSNVGGTGPYTVLNSGAVVYNTTAPPQMIWWTGQANTTNWFTPQNWGGCAVPSCSNNTSATIASVYSPGLPFPTISATGAITKNLTISPGGSLTISPAGQLDVCGNWLNIGTFTAQSGSTVRATSDKFQYFDGSMSGSSAFSNLIMNKSLAPLRPVTLFNKAEVSGALTLTVGKIVTNAKELYITNNTPTLFTAPNGNNNSYVQGNLRRSISGSGGSYDFPVGIASSYQRANVNFTTATTIPNLLSFFTGTAIPMQPGPIGPDCPTYDYSTLAPLNNGYWTMSASANATSGNYNMTLYNTNYSNSGSAFAWTVLKAPTAAGPWTLSGTCAASSTANATARDNMNGFSVFTSGQSGPPGPVPVELLTLTATAISAGVSVDWETASEINNHHFDIERSHDGVNFEKIGEKAGAGNSTENNSYSSIDPNPYEGINYYRLKQVDFDGAYEYSDRVFVTVRPDAGLVSVFPDQTSTQIGCELNADGSGPVELQILDALGKVHSTEIREVKAGYNRLEDLSVENLASGVYFMKVKGLRSEIVPLSQIKFVLPLPADARILHPSMQK